MPNTISVIITCYNLEKYIGSAIESALNQDYDSSVDIVVVDDCSTDGSADIIKSYNNIRYVRTSHNIGVLMATLLGLEHTTGDLVFFLDGDDLWHPRKISTIVAFFIANPRLALATHDLNYIDGIGKASNRLSRCNAVMSLVESADQSVMIRDGILLHSDYVWLGSAYTVRRSLANLDDFSVFASRLTDTFNTYQDWPLAFWVACQPDIEFSYTPLKLFDYRLHGANHSGDATSLDKVIRNICRTYNTMTAMHAMTVQFNADDSVRHATQQKLFFYKYLQSLYGGNRFRATAGFVLSIPYIWLSPLSFFKELIRFTGIQCLGAKRFCHLAAMNTLRPSP